MEAAPTYLKTDSYGEYIFDWMWADAYHRIGLPYYPKIVVAAPFTSVTGLRLLAHPEANREEVWKYLSLYEKLYQSRCRSCSFVHQLSQRP